MGGCERGLYIERGGKMRRWEGLVLLLFVLSSCKKEKWFDGPDDFQDNFESYVALDDLFLPKDQLWSLKQLTRSQNGISVDTTKCHGGRSSIQCVAQKSADEGASKSSIVKHNMAFWDGETVVMRAWYFIEGTQSLQWLFLMDLEEQVAVGAGPGMRLALVNDQLRMEYKFNEKDIVQKVGEEINFPRNAWVEVVWEVKLSQKHEGSVRLWQNGQLIISADQKRTLPKDILYFQQGTKGMYSSCEVGITANSKENDVRLWVDDVGFERKK